MDLSPTPWGAVSGIVCGQGRSYRVLACHNERGEVEAAHKCSLKRMFPWFTYVCVVFYYLSFFFNSVNVLPSFFTIKLFSLNL